MTANRTASPQARAFPGFRVAWLLGRLPGGADAGEPPAKLAGPGEIPAPGPSPAVQKLVREQPALEAVLQVDPSHSRLLRTTKPVFRIAITQPDVVDVNQFGPTELELIGKRSGETTVTLWLGEQAGEHDIVRYVVRVQTDRGEERRAQIEYGEGGCGAPTGGVGVSRTKPRASLFGGGQAGSR